MGLFDPLTFPGGTCARNRVALAPLTNLQSHLDGSLSEAELRWLLRRAEGGFGMVTTCASHVALDGQGWPGELGIFSDTLLPGLRTLGRGLAERGALGVVQLFHGGARAPSKVTGQQPWSASAFSENSPGFEIPRPATEEDLQRVIGQFRDAALRAREAGFHGVEIHGAHGYLLSQFLSSTMNLREDRWGGPLENRARLLREVTQAIRKATPPPFLVGVRISPEDFGYAKGLDLDESLQLADWLCADGIDFLHLSLWDAANPTKKRPQSHPIPLFREVCGTAVRILAAGSLWSREDAEATLARGADMVALGRAAILNPEWPREATQPGWLPRRPPLTPEEFHQREVSPRFVDYLRRWRGFVA
ncbi:MAG: NADH:flavin oxidoreductase [Myxococcales bacterium]|nr:NADH:flavin oxidoreductase [Polyangiaceae bacterium]MDW8251655.1 NADH:flavin oxidoreductase [Myxococcales bacterium]